MKAAYKAFISLVVLVATVACMFLLAPKYNAVFWVNLAFSVAAIVLATMVIVGLAANGRRMFGMSVTSYAIAFLILDLLYSFKTLFFPALLARRVAIAHVVLLAAFLIVIVLAKAEDEFIEKQQEIRGKDLANFKYTLERMKNVQSKVEYGAPYRKTVEHAFDSLASGQTASTPLAEEVERNILDAISELEESVKAKDEAKITQICEKLEDLAAERKAKLASKMNF